MCVYVRLLSLITKYYSHYKLILIVQRKKWDEREKDGRARSEVVSWLTCVAPTLWPFLYCYSTALVNAPPRYNTVPVCTVDLHSIWMLGRDIYLNGDVQSRNWYCLLKIQMDLLDDDDVGLCTSVSTGDVVFVAVRLEWTAKSDSSIDSIRVRKVIR